MHHTLIEQSVGVWPQIAVFTIYVCISTSAQILNTLTTYYH